MIGIYAIVWTPPKGAVVGARGETLREVRLEGFSALAGEPPPPVSAEALRAHDAAVRRIADAVDACLPARFGAVAQDAEELQHDLFPRTHELLEALQLVRGREQMTLRVHGVGAVATLAPGAGAGTRYLEERRRARKFPELDPLRAALGELIRAERVDRHSEPGLLASVYHLIDRGTAPAWLRAVEATSIEGLRLIASGPWPAWSFAPEVGAE